MIDDVKVTTRNVTGTFRLATADDRMEGFRWYAEARGFAAELDPKNPGRAAAVIAAVSPKLRWPENRRAAQLLYDRKRATFALRGNEDKARRILAGEDPDVVLKGRKVRAFWRVIANPEDPYTVVIDRHAIAVAAGRVLDDATRNRYLGRIGNYDKVARCYQRAAEILSRETGQTWTPAAVQAVTWCYWRRRHPAANSRQKATQQGE